MIFEIPLKMAFLLQPCSNRDAVDYYYPESEEILKYNVVSTTLITAGRYACYNLMCFTQFWA